MRFREELASRGWMLTSSSKAPATHLFLDGGKAAIPEEHSGTFLNMYTNAHLRGEKLCLVELKTAAFKMFFDIDAHISQDSTTEQRDFVPLFIILNQVAAEFWLLSAPPRLIICAAPPKPVQDSGVKMGFHLYWPHIVVNAPIALAFREKVLEKLDACSTLDVCNPWRDIVDASVLKANGLRMIYSEKTDAPRPYTPFCSVENDKQQFFPEPLTAADKRQCVLETSIRTFGELLTPCASGIDKLANDEKYGTVQHGHAVSLDVYADVLPKVQAALPEVYAQQQFTGVFKLDHAVMLRSSSRMCQNVSREHQTSNVYFIVTRRGVAQRCYCRKEERNCAQYCSEWYGLPLEVIDAFLPPVTQQQEPSSLEILKMPSKKRTSGDLHALLSRSRVKSKPKKRKK